MFYMRKSHREFSVIVLSHAKLMYAVYVIKKTLLLHTDNYYKYLNSMYQTKILNIAIDLCYKKNLKTTVDLLFCN